MCACMEVAQNTNKIEVQLGKKRPGRLSHAQAAPVQRAGSIENISKIL
jgi:hypothetical protein